MTTVLKEELLRQLAQLELEERDVSVRRRKLHDRVAIFPSPALQEAERELSLYRRELHRRIDALRLELSALRAAAGKEPTAEVRADEDDLEQQRWHGRLLERGRRAGLVPRLSLRR